MKKIQLFISFSFPPAFGNPTVGWLCDLMAKSRYKHKIRLNKERANKIHYKLIVNITAEP